MTDGITLDNNFTIETFEKSFNNKDKRLDAYNTVNEENLHNIVGRVIRGSEEVHFTCLEDHANKFAWVMDGDGLIRFLIQTNIEALRAIGFEDQWMQMKLEDGERFRLGIFYRSDQYVLGTWDGIFSLIDNYYSKPISMKICQYRDALKQMSFDETETRARLSCPSLFEQRETIARKRDENGQKQSCKFRITSCRKILL